MTHDRQREFEALVADVESQPRPKMDYSQLPPADFLCCHIYLLQLIHQGLFMLVWRTFGRRLNEISTKQEVKALLNAPTIPMMREAYKICTHPAGLALPVSIILDCRLEMSFLYAEMNRWGEVIPLAKKMVLLDRAYGDVADDPNLAKGLAQLLGIPGRRTSDVTAKGISRPASDSDQAAFCALLEAWRRPGCTGESIGPRPAFLAPDALLPEERPFWEGRLDRAWEASQAILDKQVPIYSREYESIDEQERKRISQELASPKTEMLHEGKAQQPDGPWRIPPVSPETRGKDRKQPIARPEMMLLTAEAHERARDAAIRAEAVKARLNETELQIFQMQAEGVQTPEIAHRLGTKEATVRTHIYRARKKISPKV